MIVKVYFTTFTSIDIDVDDKYEVLDDDSSYNESLADALGEDVQDYFIDHNISYEDIHSICDKDGVVPYVEY